MVLVVLLRNKLLCLYKEGKNGAFLLAHVFSCSLAWNKVEYFIQVVTLLYCLS